MKIRRVDFYPDEWIAGTIDLNLAERGMYITACTLIYSHGGAIAVEHLRDACKCHGRTFSAALDRLIALGKLIRNEDEISNKRCSNEIEKANKRISKAIENGPKGGRPSNKNKEIENQNGFPTENPNYQPTTNNHQPEDSVGSDEPTAAAAASEPDLSIVAGTDLMSEPELRTEVYRAGKEILGQKAGGQITKLIERHAGNLHETMDTFRMAKRKENPREYVAAIIRGRPPDTDWDAIYGRMGVQ